MTFLVLPISLQLEIAAFWVGWGFSPHPAQSPFLGWVQRSGAFLEKGHKEQS